MKTPIFCLFIFLFLIACKKENITDPPSTPNQPVLELAEDYSQLNLEITGFINDLI